MICCRQRKRQQSCNKECAYGWNGHIVPPVKLGGKYDAGMLLLQEMIVKQVFSRWIGARNRAPLGAQPFWSMAAVSVVKILSTLGTVTLSGAAPLAKRVVLRSRRVPRVPVTPSQNQ